MRTRGLAPDVMLSIHLSAICSRNRYTSDPAPVVDELLAVAGDRVEVLQETIGSWVGYYEDAHTRTLCAALRELPGLEEGIAVGAYRRALKDHSTPPVSYGR